MLSAIISLGKEVRIEYTDKPFHHVNINSDGLNTRITFIPVDPEKMAELGTALLAAVKGLRDQRGDY